MYITYDNLFTFVLMILAIITLVKSFYDNQKSSRPHLGRIGDHFV